MFREPQGGLGVVRTQRGSGADPGRRLRAAAGISRRGPDRGIATPGVWVSSIRGMPTNRRACESSANGAATGMVQRSVQRAVRLRRAPLRTRLRDCAVDRAAAVARQRDTGGACRQVSAENLATRGSDLCDRPRCRVQIPPCCRFDDRQTPTQDFQPIDTLSPRDPQMAQRTSSLPIQSFAIAYGPPNDRAALVPGVKENPQCSILPR